MAELTEGSKQYIKHLESKVQIGDIYKLLNDLREKINSNRLIKNPPRTPNNKRK